MVQSSARFSSVTLRLLVFASLTVFSRNLLAQTISPARIDNRPGIVVFRAKPFYADDLVKCARFSRVEDRTAAGNPAFGYFAFATSGGELQLTPQAIEARFFLEDLQFPETLKPSSDLERITELKEHLQLVSRFNSSISNTVHGYLLKMSEAVAHLQKGDWLENGARWVTKEERDRRTALDEKATISSASNEVRANLTAANDFDAINRLIDAIPSIENLPATSTEVSGYRKTAAAKLRNEAGRKLIDLEQAFVGAAHFQLKSSIKAAGSLDDILAITAKIRDLAKAPIASPQAVSAREKCIEELQGLSSSKERNLRLSTAAFENLSAWKAALDDSRKSSAGSGSEESAIIERSEALYQQAIDVNKELEQASSTFRSFLAGLQAQAILSGNELPLLPSSLDAALKNYEAFINPPGSSSPVAVGVMVDSAAVLKRHLALYRQFAAMSKRANRQNLWNSLLTFDELLTEMHAVQEAILNEKAKHDQYIVEARGHEVSKDFASAAGAYQSAHDIAPSSEMAAKVQSMKDQDLGL
jgi:hypothetical protein